MANYDPLNTWLSLQPLTGIKLADDSYTLNVHPSGIMFDDNSAIVTAHHHQITGVRVSAGGSLMHLFSTGVLFNDNTAQTTAAINAPEGEAIKSATNSNETAGKVLKADGDGTCSWETTANLDTGFVLEDGDGTEVTITEGKEVKIVEGVGIDVDWTDTDNGTDGDPFDLTISCNIEGTEVSSTTNGNEADTKFLRADGDGTCSWQTAGASVAYGEVNFITPVDISVYADDGNPTNDTWISISANAAWEGANSLIIAAMTYDADTGGNTDQELHFRAQSGSTEVSIIGHTGTSGQRSVAVEQAMVPVKADGTAEFKYNQDSTGRLNYLRVVGYMDGNLGTSLEGTKVKSTTNSNEAATKFLRADGDGTCSWQNPSLSEAGAFWSSGWVNEDDSSVAVANGATLTFTHSLGSTDVIVNMWVSSSSDGSNPQLLNGVSSSAGSERGALITNLSADTCVLQLRREGFLEVDSDGVTSSVASFASKYIKLNVVAGGVDATTITPEGTSVKSTTNSNETSGKVLTADGDGTSSWQAVTTGDITGVDLTGGAGISIDSETNTTGGAYSSTITCNVEGTEVASTTNGNEATSKFLRADGDGTCSWQNPSLVDAGAFWSSGWVNADDDSTAIANGETLSFAHSLGSTDVLVQIYVADDSSGTNSSAISDNTANSGASTDDLGAMVTDLSSNSIEIQLGAEGWRKFNGTGYFTFHVFTSKYIKVNVVAGGVDVTSITPEGTSVKSTTDSNEDLGKFLRADGDGTCSWEFATLNSVMGGTPFRTQYEVGDDATWVKPEGVTLVHIMAIGAGGGQSGFYGSSGQNKGGGWGGQGGRVSQYVDVSGISSAAITIGTGGNGGSGVNTHGNAGGDTTFGSLLIAGGGARGEYHYWHQTYGGRGKDGRITGSAVSGIHEAIPEVIPQAPLQAAYDGDIGTYGIGGNGGELYWPTSWTPGWDPRVRIYPADGVMHSGGFHCNDDYSGGDPLTATGHYSTQHVTRDGSQCGGPARHWSQGGPGGPGVLVLTIIG